MNLMSEFEKLTSKVTDSVALKAKDSALSTLNDPEFKKTVNQFTKDWFNENKLVLASVVGSCFILSMLAIANIVSNYKRK